MNIGIIDADLLSRRNHRFPNLVCMKLSNFHKNIGDKVKLLTDYNQIDDHDKVYIAKVFTDTFVDDKILTKKNVEYGGTGFFYDKAVPLPYEIEHCMPDYNLYEEFVIKKIISGDNPSKYKYYTDYSIGFLTRGCFRKCAFCVNKNYNKVSLHSPLDEFVDSYRRKICLLDDNFLGYSDWKKLLNELKDSGKRFQFKQGLDEGILTDEKCELLFNSKYDGEFIFAFDNWADHRLIEDKLKLIRKYTDKIVKFYCFCGFDRLDKWDLAFWKNDMVELFNRIELLIKYRCLPYIMRYYRYEESPYRGMYITIARWCNQPAFFKKKLLREFVEANNSKTINGYMDCFEKEFSSYYLDNVRW